MKFKLHKSDQKKQDLIQHAIRHGLPLVGLFAATTLAAGTSETSGAAVDGDVMVPKNRQTASSETTASTPVPPVERKVFVTAGVMPAPPRALPKETEIYVVKAGDTLDRIAKTYKVSLEILKELNNFTHDQASRLKIGQKIIVPKAGNRNSEATPKHATVGKPVKPK